MKFIFFSIALASISFNAHARCNGTYADHLLEARFTGCSGNFLDQAQAAGNFWSDVSSICADGCYSALFNQDLRAECDRRYAAAIQQNEAAIIRAANESGCTDQGGSTPTENVNSRSLDDNCSWLTRTSTQLNCGGAAPDQNVCGVGGKSICSGEVVCAKESDFDGTSLPAGNYDITCLSQGENCSAMPVSTCAADIHTSPNFEVFYNNTISPAVERARSVQ